MFNKGCASDPMQLSTYLINKFNLQDYWETYCLWSAYLSTSEQSNYTPSTRISYKTLYCTQLLEALNDWTLFLKSKFGIDSVYTDIAKAVGTSLYQIPPWIFIHMSYSERLKLLKLDTLELRRYLYIDLILCFKICNVHVTLDKNDVFKFNPEVVLVVIAWKSPFLTLVSMRTSALLCSPSYSCSELLTSNRRSLIVHLYI